MTYKVRDSILQNQERIKFSLLSALQHCLALREAGMMHLVSRAMLKGVFLFLMASISACSFNSNITLTREEKLFLAKSVCKGPSVLFVNTPANADIVKRWRFLCPLRKISLTDEKLVNAIVVNAADSFLPDRDSEGLALNGTGFFCTSKPFLQTSTLFVIPLICNYNDTFGPCIKKGTKVKCLEPPVGGESVEYIGWIPILTHAIPHALGSLWSDSLQDRIIVAIQKELNKFN